MSVYQPHQVKCRIRVNKNKKTKFTIFLKKASENNSPPTKVLRVYVNTCTYTLNIPVLLLTHKLALPLQTNSWLADHNNTLAYSQHIQLGRPLTRTSWPCKVFRLVKDKILSAWWKCMSKQKWFLTAQLWRPTVHHIRIFVGCLLACSGWLWSQWIWLHA